MVHPSFSYTTPKVDFTKPIDPSGLRDKHVLISGGANGWGARLARRFCAEGQVPDLIQHGPEAFCGIQELKRLTRHAGRESRLQTCKQAMGRSLRMSCADKDTSKLCIGHLKAAIFLFFKKLST